MKQAALAARLGNHPIGGDIQTIVFEAWAEPGVT
jgi:hypothetical protein